MLEQANAEKENVGVTSELFIQELGDEGDDTVLCCRDLIGFEFLFLKQIVKIVKIELRFVCKSYLNGVDIDCPSLAILGGWRIGSPGLFRHITGHGNVNNSGLALINTRGELPAQTEPSVPSSNVVVLIG